MSGCRRFKENRLVKGEFVGLGCKLNLRDIKCPAYLLAGRDGAFRPPTPRSREVVKPLFCYPCCYPGEIFKTGIAAQPLKYLVGSDGVTSAFSIKTLR